MALPRKMRALRGIRDIGWFESNESRYVELKSLNYELHQRRIGLCDDPITGSDAEALMGTGSQAEGTAQKGVKRARGRGNRAPAWVRRPYF